jgi:hypothetical protein
MIIGISQIELFIPGSNSLKHKRGVVKSLKDRLRNKFNISISEIDYQNLWQRCMLGVAVINSDSVIIDKVLNKVLDVVESEPRVQVISYQMEKL